MKRFLHGPILRVLIVIIGFVFIGAGWGKIRDPQSFEDSIYSFRMIPNSWIAPMALGLPVFEMILGLLLIVGIQRRSAALGIFILTFVFFLALMIAKIRGIEVNCGCFGGMERLSSYKAWLAIGRDLLIVMGAFWIYSESTAEA